MKKYMLFLIIGLCMMSGCASPTNETGAPLPNAETPVEEKTVIEELVINIEKGHLTVCQGDALSFIDAQGNDLSSQIPDDQSWVSITSQTDAVLTLPKDSFKAIRIKMTDGEVTFKDTFKVDELDFVVKNGKAEVENIIVAEKSNIVFTNGSFDFNGDFGKEVIITDDYAAMNINLTSAQNDYNYHISAKEGTLYLGNDVYGEMSLEKIDNGSDRNMKIEITHAPVHINFQ